MTTNIMNILGKVAIVTGGASGLGKCYVKMLLENGAKVCIADILEEKARETVDELSTKFATNVMCATCDVTQVDQLKEAFNLAEEAFHCKISILVNNAGILFRDQEKRGEVLKVNINGVMNGSYTALEYMSKDNRGLGGIIVNITSIAGLVTPGGNPSYVASKHAVTAFTQSLALEVSEKSQNCGVAVCGLAPTFVKTDIVPNSNIADLHKESTAYKMFNEYGGFSRAEDVAAGLISLLQREDNHNVILLVKGKVLKRIKTTIEELDW